MGPYAAGSIMVIFFSILMIAVAVAATVFWVWMLIDCAMQEPSAMRCKTALPAKMIPITARASVFF